MGRKHSEMLMLAFPNQKGVGIDLPKSKTELKESTVGILRLKNKDNRAKFIIFYDSINYDFYYIDKNDFSEIRKYHKFSLDFVKRIAFFQTNDICEIVEKEKEIQKLFQEGKI